VPVGRARKRPAAAGSKAVTPLATAKPKPMRRLPARPHPKA
jgi:hypothetical protein